MLAKKIKDESGFTLIEVFTVSVVLAVIAACAMTILNGYKKRAFENIALKTAAELRNSFEAGQGDLGIDLFAEIHEFNIKLDGSITCDNNCDEITDPRRLFPGFSHNKNVKIIMNTTTGNSYSMIASHCNSKTSDNRYNSWSLSDILSPTKVFSSVGAEDVCV